MTMNGHSPRAWRIPGFQYQPGDVPLIMGILNTTPDSFSDGGKFLAEDVAVERALTLVAEGADIVDIGGESTRPGAGPVSLEDELRRVIPVIERLATLITVPISIDTSKAEVARQALAAGAKIVNDISGLQGDPQMLEVCLRHPCGVITMHMQGTPQTMQQAPHYDNVVEDLFEHFTRHLSELERRGLPLERLAIDPGIGFGKTAQHNVDILMNVARFQQLDRPVLIGHSRKRFLQKLVGRPLDERLFGTIGVSVALAQQHVDLIRVHDVAANRDAIAAWRATMPRSAF